MHFGLFGILVALHFGKSIQYIHPIKQYLNVLLALCSIATSIYLIIFEQSLYDRGVSFSTLDWIVSIATIVIALELVRRTTGWLIPILTIIALTYVFWWGKYVPGIFNFSGLGLETVLYRSYFSADGMFGTIARISWSYVFMFILFGAFLMRSGASDAIIALSQSAAGRLHGGPGFVAVLSSGLMGSISGSAIANTASTGVITIPLMKKSGFPARFAAGAEAAASTGGQLMPPVMGAGAFIMASFTGTSYLNIIAIAFFPAVLYFLSVSFFIRIEAKRQNLALHSTAAPPALQVLRERWTTLLPIPVLIVLLIAGLTPTYAAALSILTVIVVSWVSPNPLYLRDIINALADGARNMAPTAILLVTIGLIVNVVSTTGLGNTLSLMISSWAGGNLFAALVFIALASLILGMGLPVTAAYIVLATLSAPLLYDLMSQAHLVSALVAGGLSDQANAFLMISSENAPQLLADGLTKAEAMAIIAVAPADLLNLIRNEVLNPEILLATLLTAHLIIFWLSQDSNVTPPVCLAAFTAASIAKTPPMATGLEAWKIAKGLYLIPLIMAYSPLIGGTPTEIASVLFFSVFGVYAAAGTLHGHLEGPLNVITWSLSGIAAGLLLWPHNNLVLSILGLLLLTISIWHSRKNFHQIPS